MNKDNAQALGKQEASSWLMVGTLPARQMSVQIKTNLDAIAGVCRRLEAAAYVGSCPARDWLLDNWHLARRAGMQARQAFQCRLQLPAIQLEGKLPRIQRVGQLLAQAEALDESCIIDFLTGIQEIEPLDEEELALVPGALEAGLLLRLRGAAEALEQRLNRGEDPASLEEELRQVMRRFAHIRTFQLASSLEQLSMVDRLFREDPSGVYAKMDPESRWVYRRMLCKLARKRHMSQAACAQQVLELARQGEEHGDHIGAYLFSAQRGASGTAPRCGWYGSLLALVITMLSLWAGFGLGRWWAILLFLLPVSELVKNAADFVLLHLIPPRPVFRLDLKQGIPPEGKTLCVIAALLTGEASVKDLTHKLERYALANRRAGKEVSYGVLADLPDRDHPMTPEDQVLLDQTALEINTLNQMEIGSFCLFFREPVHCPGEKRYRGRERKRGAILQLTRYLRGRRGELRLLAGDEAVLRGTKFLLVLDGDTILTVDSVSELAGAMLHPLNQPEVDPKRRIVTKGYGILQPRVETELSSASASTFARLFSGLGGLDPYGGAVSDLYHDLFDQASFLGKGLIHIDAFLTCMDGRFPENRILSHDLLEGSYLHTGWVSRTELMDSVPGNALSWLDRYHRWIRGDWQLLGWLGGRVKDEAGEWVENPISALSKWKIADNLRRSLAPPATLLALLLGVLQGGPLFTAAALVALAASASQLLSSVAELLWRRGQGSFRQYHSGVFSGLSGGLLRTGIQLLFLPVQSWTALSAILCALWRMTITHKHLLDWVTSDQSSRNRGRVTVYVRRFFPAVIFGILTLFWANHPVGRLLGLAWVLTPLLFYRWGKPRPVARPVSERDRAFLLHEGALIWRFYESWLRPEYRNLIPDNVQALPDKGAAIRTSPTNLGLALLSCLAAVDLHFIPSERGEELIERQLIAIEQLERWHGHLYNWYDIETGDILQPRYISTVDSGNLCADLIAVSQGLQDLGRRDLASRARRLADEMDFSVLYDPSQQLFYIGYDVEAGQYTPSHYDLMVSEARMTSYLAVARGEVPSRHWRQLSRALVKANGFTGMASWSGTMFEYLMPQLLLPCYPDSLLSETLAYCVDQQQRWGKRLACPWGVSESAYYALDHRQNYQYKAHGIPALALQRGHKGEQVVAPYASFLALMVAPGPAIANLRRLREMGAEGRYGLYEALDFTSSRGGSRRNPLMIQSWMAHHLGMSLLAIDNCLNDFVMVKRFFSDPTMAAYQELLQEKIPVGAPVSKPEPVTQPVRPPERGQPAWRRSGTGYDPADPVWGILSNEGYSVFLSAGGSGFSRFDGQTLLHPEGVQIAVERGGVRTPVFPREETDGALSWAYASGQGTLTWKGEAFTLSQKVVVDRNHNGELRVVTITARQALEGTLCILLRPVLSIWDNYAAHPAFSRMCIETQYVGTGVRFARKPGRGAPAPVLTVLWSDQDAGWTTNRERYLVTGSISHTGREGVVLDPCLALELPFSLRSGQKQTLRLAIAAGDQESSLVMAQGLLALRKPVPAPALDQLARVLGRETVSRGFVLLSRLLAPGMLGREGVVEGQQSLWPFSISGDLPIVTFRVQEEALEESMILAGMNQLLGRLGSRFDLVLLLPEQGDYLQTLRTALTGRLQAAGWSQAIGQPGGIYLISGSEEQWQPILGMATLNLCPGDRLDQANQFHQVIAPAPLPSIPWRPMEWCWGECSFTLMTNGSLPPLRWSHLLVNERIGWRCDEAGTGHLWAGNAQMEQLTPWQNDPIALRGPEDLRYHLAGKEYSLFARQDGIPVTVIYGPGSARWEKTISGRQITLTAFVPHDRAVRLFLISVRGAAKDDWISWHITPKLAHRDSHMPWLRWEMKGNVLYLNNPAGSMAGRTLLLSSAQPFQDWSVQRGEAVFRLDPGQPQILAASMEPESVLNTLLSPEAAERSLEETGQWWREKTASLSVSTPYKALNHYLSFWGPYQVLAGRLLGRSSLYQCGGAFGFRDQLQDALALLPSAPEIVRAQILRAARHQFREGDVMHWWHPSEGGDSAQGVRTRISDDLLWLPYVLGRWVEEIGDTTLLGEQVPYLEGRPLDDGEEERYERCAFTQERDSVYRHAVQAIECVLNRGVGSHGLCLIGTGDWNDGMNRLGDEGRGESVWLTWFFALTLRTFLPLCRIMHEDIRAERYERLIHNLIAAAHGAWDGKWYLRAYDDEGNPVGSHGNEECAIDSIAQSFAVLAPGPDPELAHQAVLAAAERLYDREHQLARLLWPPFRGAGDPGYIRSYPGGIRENGGQYTHAACWLAMALLESGEKKLGAQLLHDLLPENHPWETYRAEPYVLAGDVYSAPDQEGRAGWSWYTGAASWYCQTATRTLLGLRLKGGKLSICPKLPEDWPGYEALWRGANYELFIRVLRGTEPGLRLDGTAWEEDIDLRTLQGRHEAIFVLPT